MYTSIPTNTIAMQYIYENWLTFCQQTTVFPELMRVVSLEYCIKRYIDLIGEKTCKHLPWKLLH